MRNGWRPSSGTIVTATKCYVLPSQPRSPTLPSTNSQPASDHGTKPPAQAGVRNDHQRNGAPGRTQKCQSDGGAISRMMIDVQRLMVLRKVARAGSFAGAAAALHHTPSAVSQQIAALERSTRAVLVERSTRGVTLTHAGLVLLAS